MAEKMKALFRGATDERGLATEWLGEEPANEPGGEPTPPVPARHLTQEEYDALSPRNKERVKDARNAFGGPLYEVRAERELASAPKADATKDGE